MKYRFRGHTPSDRCHGSANPCDETQQHNHCAAFQADKSRVKGYIHRLDNFDGLAVAKIALDYEMFGEAFDIYRKFGLMAQAISMLLDNQDNLERALEYATEVSASSLSEYLCCCACSAPRVAPQAYPRGCLELHLMNGCHGTWRCRCCATIPLPVVSKAVRPFSCQLPCTASPALSRPALHYVKSQHDSWGASQVGIRSLKR